jgi:hypothetical protein
MVVRQVASRLRKVRSRDVNSAIGLVMTKEHPQECLHFGRANALAGHVAFALHGNSFPLTIARPDVYVQIAGTAHPVDVSVADVVQQVRNSFLELPRAQGQQFTEGLCPESAPASLTQSPPDKQHNGD